MQYSTLRICHMQIGPAHDDDFFFIIMELCDTILYDVSILKYRGTSKQRVLLGPVILSSV